MSLICSVTVKYMTLLGSLILSKVRQKSLTTGCINDCRTYSHHHWYSSCASVLLTAQCLIPVILLFSKPQPQLHSRTRVEYHYQPRPFTKTDRDHYLYASCRQAVWTPLYADNLYAIHRQFCHTALFKKYILRSRSFYDFVLASFSSCMLIHLRTSDQGSLVARPSIKPYTIKVAY